MHHVGFHALLPVLVDLPAVPVLGAVGVWGGAAGS